MPFSVARFSKRRRGRVGSVVVVADTFTRADSAVSLGSTETGSAGVLAWTSHTATAVWGISTNRAYCPTSTASGANATVNAAVADCSVSLTLAVFENGQGNLLFRYVDESNFLFVAPVTAGFDLYRVSGGAFTVIGTNATAPASGDVVKATFSGSAITIYVNDVSRITATESAHSTATRHGMRAGAAPTTMRVDNFLVTT